jgi:hypothetical protein
MSVIRHLGSGLRDAFDTVVVLLVAGAILVLCRANDRHKRTRLGR